MFTVVITTFLVTCLYQLYSAVWCFQANGDVYAFQDVEPFKRLGVTKKLTSDPVVQILTNRENQLIIATKSGGVYLAALSTSGSSFQLEVIKVKFTHFRAVLEKLFLDFD